MELDYITEDDDYSIAEFYDKFHTELPMVVRVSQGSQGNGTETNFALGEVLYIAAVAKQKRVVARVKKGEITKNISIPITFSETLCVRKYGKCGNEHTLAEILKHNWLPLTIQYPPSNIIFMDDKTIKSSDLPHLHLVKKFHEKHLLGHFLNEGKLGGTIINIPVTNSQLRICRVTGIKHLTHEGWVKHCDSLKEESSRTSYDLLFGNEKVAEYANLDKNSQTKYTFTQPLLYDDLVNIITRWPECSLGNPADDSTNQVTRSCSSTSQTNTKCVVYEDLIEDKNGQLSAYEALSRTEDNKKESIKDMSCDEILIRLKKLGLDKYVQMFYFHRIDGELLASMDDVIVVEELGMTKEEFSRLKDISQDVCIERADPVLQPKSHSTKPDANLLEIHVPNQKPELNPKRYIKTSNTSTLHSCQDTSKDKAERKSEENTKARIKIFDVGLKQLFSHAIPNTYSPMPKNK